MYIVSLSCWEGYVDADTFANMHPGGKRECVCYHEMPTLPSSLSPFTCLAYMGFPIWGYPPPTPPWDLWPRSVDLAPLETPCSLCCWLLMLLDLWWSHLPRNQLVCVSWGVKVEWSWWWWPTSLLSGCGWGEKSTCSSAGKSEQEWLHICAYTSLTYKWIHTKSQIHIPSTVPSSFRVNELWGSKGWPVRHGSSGDAQSLVSVMTSDMASQGQFLETLSLYFPLHQFNRCFAMNIMILSEWTHLESYMWNYCIYYSKNAKSAYSPCQMWQSGVIG